MCSLLCLAVAAILSVNPLLAEVTDSPALPVWEKLTRDGRALFDQGRFAEAAVELEKAVHCAERFTGSDSRLPATIHTLAFAYQQQGKYPEAIAMYLRAIHLWESGPPQQAALFRSVDNLIGTYVEAHDYRAARKLLESRLPEMERSAALWAQHPGCPQGDHAVAWMNLSHVLATTGRYQEALETDLEAVAILERLDAKFGSLQLRGLEYAASLCQKLRRPADAEQYYQRALPTARRMFGPGDSHVAEIELSYSAILRTLHRGEEAKLMASEAQAALRSGGERRAPVDILALTPVR
jgi:tetratricopeptide (TPR) repeat protein